MDFTEYPNEVAAGRHPPPAKYVQIYSKVTKRKQNGIKIGGKD